MFNSAKAQSTVRPLEEIIVNANIICVYYQYQIICPRCPNPKLREAGSDENAEGKPVISWRPDLNEGGKKHLRKYTVDGKAKLADEWGAPDDASRFFRVRVELLDR